MRMPLAKLKAMLLYFCENTDPRFLGKVKLMKLFYFLDFVHVKKYGVPVTWDNYINMEHGPVPSTVKNLVYSVDDEPNDAILADTITIEHSDGQAIHRILPLRKFGKNDSDLLSETEREVLEEISKRFFSANQAKIEKAAHEEAPWATTKEMDSIPYTLAALDPDSQFTEEELELYNKL